MRCLHLILLVLFLDSMSAQLCTLELVRYDKTSGLPTDEINWVREDGLGFLWLATDIGLFCFDGSGCRQIDLIGKRGSLTGASLGELYFDKQGMLWIGTNFDGAIKYDPRKGTTLHYPSNLTDTTAVSANRIYGFFEDDLDRLWMTAHGQGLCRYDPDHDQFVRIRPYKDEAELRKYKDFPHMISSTIQDADDSTSYWMASLHGIIHWTSPDGIYTYLNPPGEIVGFRSIHQDPDGIIWGVTWGRGIWRYDPKQSSWGLFRCSDRPNSAFTCLNASDIHQLDPHTLLIASEQGLLFLNTKTMQFDTSCLGQGTVESESFFVDSKGQLWIASPGEGLFLLHQARQKFRRVADVSGVHHVTSDPSTGEIYAVSDDTLYSIATGGNVISKMTHARYLFQDEHYLTDLFFDTHDQLWILDMFGLYQPEGNRLLPYDHPDQATLALNGYYWCAVLDHFDVCWFLSQGSGVWSLNLRTQKLIHYDYEAGNPQSLVHNYSIATGFLDRDGDVWGSASSGIFYYDQGKAVFVNSDSPLLFTDSSAVGTPTAFVQDHAGRIILGQFMNRPGSLEKGALHGQLVTPLPGFSDLPHGRLNDMLFDSEGDLWLAGKDGIVRYNPKTQRVDYYGPSFGISEVTDLELMRDGIMIAAVNGNILMFDISELPPSDITPRPVVTAFRIFDQTYQSREGARVPYISDVSLRYTQNFFSFDFGAIDYSSQQTKQYAYKLEGLDKEWNYPEKGRQYAAYTNVGGGRFIFRVKVRNPGSAWSPDEAQLIVSITPPLWQRPWFIACIATLLFLLGWTLYRYRIREIKKKEALITAFNKQLAETEMKALRAQMNPHFLFNTLNAIKLYVQKNDQEMAVTYLTDFAKLIRHVLQNSAHALIPLSAELHALDLYIRIERMRFDATFDYQINIAEEISPDSMRIPPLLLQPYVENAIWHGLMHKNDGHGLLKVLVSREGKDVYYIVEDNGIGREAAKLIRSKSAEKNKSMGMQITRDRMDISGKMSDTTFHVDIQDLHDVKGVPSGTRVILRVSPKH